ncbi:MAG: hypothetical protein WDA71_06930 [Actinomycetota bacterium]
MTSVSLPRALALAGRPKAVPSVGLSGPLAPARVLKSLASVGVLGGLLVGLVVGPLAVPGACAPASGRRAVLLFLDGTSLSDWSRADLPGFAALRRRASFALASTRRIGATTSAAFAEISAGARAAGVKGTGRLAIGAVGQSEILADGSTGAEAYAAANDRLVPEGEILVPLSAGLAAANDRRDVSARMGALGDAMAKHGLVVSYAGAGAARAGQRLGAIAAMDSRGAVPLGRLTGPDPTTLASAVSDLLGLSALVVAEWPAALGVEGADRALLEILQRLSPNDLLVVSSPRELVATPVMLAPLAVAGPGFAEGLLYSPTTRRRGLVGLTDIGPTITTWLGAPSPKNGSGRPVQSRPDPNPMSSLSRLEHESAAGVHARGWLLRAYLITAYVAIVLAALLLGYAKRPRTRRVLACFAASVPAAFLLAPLLPHGSVGAIATAVAAVAIALTVAASSHQRGLAYLLAATASLVALDLLLGGHLARMSVLSYLAGSGARFYGVGNEYMGVAIAGALLGGTILAERVPRGGWWLAGGLVMLAAVLATPGLGSKLGAATTAVPAFALLLLLRAGRKLHGRTLALAVLVGTAAVGLAVGLDVVRGGSTHLARAAEGGWSTGLALAWTKLEVVRYLLRPNVWVAGIAVGVASLGLLGVLKPETLRVPPRLGQALVAAGAAALLAVATNDAGTLGACLIVMLATTTWLSAADGQGAQTEQAHAAAGPAAGSLLGDRGRDSERETDSSEAAALLR